MSNARNSAGRRGGRLRLLPPPLPAILRAFGADRKGIATIEFAFAAVAFLTLLIGVLEYGQVMWVRNTLQNAAAETGRYAMVHTTATQTQLVAYAKTAAAPLNPDDVAVQVTWDTTGGTTYVTILTSYQFQEIVPFMPQGTISLVGRARMPQVS